MLRALLLRRLLEPRLTEVRLRLAEPRLPLDLLLLRTEPLERRDPP